MPLIYIAVAAVAYVVDRWSKNWAAGALRDVHGGSLPLIEGVFHFTYAENRGAAFSMICLMGVYFLFFNRKKLPVWPSLCIAMALGGALGNLYDRIVLGYVIDMLDFCLINFAVFNAADSFVCVGVIMLGVWMVFFEEKQMPNMPYRWGAPKAAAESETTVRSEEEYADDPQNRDN